MAPGVMLALVLLHTLKFTVSAVGYGIIVSIPVVSGTYPVTAVGSALKLTIIASVLNVPVAVPVWAVVQAALDIAPVARAFAPLAIVAVPDVDVPQVIAPVADA